MSLLLYHPQKGPANTSGELVFSSETLRLGSQTKVCSIMTLSHSYDPLLWYPPRGLPLQIHNNMSVLNKNNPGNLANVFLPFQKC